MKKLVSFIPFILLGWCLGIGYQMNKSKKNDKFIMESIAITTSENTLRLKRQYTELRDSLDLIVPDRYIDSLIVDSIRGVFIKKE